MTADNRQTEDVTAGRPSDRGIPYHFQIVDLKTLVVSSNDSSAPHLHVQSLQVLATRAGLSRLVEHFGPENVDLALTFAQPGGETGSDIIVRASRWGFTATLRARLRLRPESNGLIQVELAPGKFWSPADRAMLAIVRRQVAAKTEHRSEIVATGSRAFDIDIQYLVNRVLTEGDLPVQWSAMLSGIEASEDEIRLHFTPDRGPLEATLPTPA